MGITGWIRLRGRTQFIRVYFNSADEHGNSIPYDGPGPGYVDVPDENSLQEKYDELKADFAALIMAYMELEKQLAEEKAKLVVYYPT